MVGRVFGQRDAEELPQRKAVAATPGDAPLRADAFEVADQQHAKIDARRNRRPAEMVVVIRLDRSSRPCGRTPPPPTAGSASDRRRVLATSAGSWWPPTSPAVRPFAFPTPSSLPPASCDGDIIFLFGIHFKDYFNGLLRPFSLMSTPQVPMHNVRQASPSDSAAIKSLISETLLHCVLDEGDAYRTLFVEICELVDSWVDSPKDIVHLVCERGGVVVGVVFVSPLRKTEPAFCASLRAESRNWSGSLV